MHVMIAEDDADTAAYIGRSLAELGHTPEVVGSGGDAVARASTTSFDVIVLDRMLPGFDGMEVLRRLRAAAVGTPVLMVTALGGIADRVEGLDAGADDYLVKPFAISELAARLNALTRRQPAADSPIRFEVGDVVLDLLRRDVFRSGRPVRLQPREFAILEQMMRHAGRVITRTMLLELVWGFHFDPQTNIVESHMSRMRTKLREGHATDPIETIRGTGYRMQLL